MVVYSSVYGDTICEIFGHATALGIVTIFKEPHNNNVLFKPDPRHAVCFLSEQKEKRLELEQRH